MSEHPLNRPALRRRTGPAAHARGRGPAGLRRVLLQAVGGAALLVWDVQAAWAACSPAAANDVVAVCDGATTSVFGSQTQTNGSITISAGASLSVAASRAIDFASLTQVTNYGTIAAAPAANTSATAISAYSASVTLNNGAGASVTATASGTGSATGVFGRSFADVTNASTASIAATASGTGGANGIYTDNTYLKLNNSGSITASGGGASYGAYVSTYVELTNNSSGVLSAISTGGEVGGLYAKTTITAVNNNEISAKATGGSAGAYAILGRTTIHLNNSATVSAKHEGTGAAYGVWAWTVGTLAANTGSISATSASGSAYGFYTSGEATVTNNSGGSLSASSTSGETAGLYARGVLDATNQGSITAATGSSSNTAAGIEARTALGLSNSGVVQGATGGSGTAYGLWSWTTATLSSNTGSITGSATGSGAAYGLRGDTAASVVSNAGSIQAISAGAGAAYAVFGAGTATISSNTGAITARSASGAAAGVAADTTAANVTNASTGSITASALGATGNAIGITGRTTATVSNAGTITASAAGAGISYGVLALTSSGTVSNTGTIAGSSATGIAYSVYAITDATVSNASTGVLRATTGGSSSTAYGVRAGATASVSNNGGTISAENTGNWSANGVLAGSSATVTNSGLIEGTSAGAGAGVGVKTTTSLTLANTSAITGLAHGVGNAFGLYVGTDANVTSNSGTLWAASQGSSGAGLGYGVYAANAASLSNSGTIAGSTAGSGNAAGVYALNADATLTNTGTASVTAQATGSGSAYGLFAGGTASLSNAQGSTLSATASSGSAYGLVGYVAATVTNHGLLAAAGTDAYAAQSLGDIGLSNDGQISASASTGSGYGIYSSMGIATVSNSGTIAAASQGSAYALSADTAQVSNSGTIAAASSAAGSSYGVWANVVALGNTGTVSATNSAGGAAYGVYALNTASLSNSASSTISASTQGADAYAIYAAYGLSVSANHGTISAQTDGAGQAFALSAPNIGDVTVSANSGSLRATASGTGAAYGLYADNAATLAANTGNLSASSGSGTAFGVYGAASATVNNAGVLQATSSHGAAYAIYGGSDTNAAAWLVSPTSYRADATLDNAGIVIASAGGTGDAYGLYGGSYAVLSNRSGAALSAMASGSGNAYGINAGSYATVSNAASASISASSGSGNAYAVRSNDATTSISNSGAISATSASGLSYGLYLSGGAASISNTGSISGQTASVLAGGPVATVLNWQGGNAADASSTALRWSGTLPGQYTLGVLSPTRYGQIWLSNPSGTMAVNLDSSSTLALGSYAKAVTGVSASAISSSAGTLGLFKWQLSLSDSSNGYWDLLVTPNGIASGESKAASALNQSFMPYFFGGALQIDSNGSTLSDNFVLDASSTNTLALGGKSVTLRGAFSNAVGSAGRINFSGGGTATLTANNTYSGATGIDSATTLRIGDGGTSGTIGSGAVRNDGLLVINRANLLVLANDMAGTGALTQSGSGTTVLTGNNTYSGTTTISAGTLQVGQGASTGSLGSGAVVNNGVLRFNRSDAMTVSNAISGSGTLVQQGSGALTLNGINSYAAIDNQSSIASLTNYQGGAGSALNYSGTLPSQYWALVTSPTQYAQLNVSSYAGAMAFGLAPGSSISDGRYVSVVSGVTANAYLGATSGLWGNYAWRLIAQSSNATVWDMVVGSTTIAPGAVQNVSQLAPHVELVLQGGGLRLDQSSSIDNPLKLQAGANNTIDLAGHNATLSGNLTDANGPGALRFAGGGNASLTGNNSYSGTTTIDTGTTLSIGAGGTTGNLGTGPVHNTGTLVSNRSDAMTLSNAISGSGNLQQSGSGTTTLTGTNSYTGTTTISAGTLQVGDGGTSGTLGSGPVVNNSTLAVNRSDALTLSNPISGGGSLSLAGGGSTTLEGDNSFSGGVRVGVGSTLVINRAAALGSGPLSLVGSSTVPAYLKVNSSTLIANRISVQGDPVFDIAAGASVSISAPIVNGASAGDVLVQGGGTLNLLAVNTYTGPTTISAGATLALADAGSIASSTSLTNQGKLDVRGLAANSVSLPQFSQGASGQLLMRVGASGAQWLSVSGSAHLNGTLALSAQPGSYKSGIFKILTAEQLSGSFSHLTTDLGNYVRSYTLLYSPQGVDLELVLGPDAANSGQALAWLASAQTAVMKQRNQWLSDMLGQECLPGQSGQSCMEIQGRYGRSAMGNEGTGLVSGAWQLTPALRMGGYVEQGDVKLRNAGVAFSSSAPSLGAFVRWNANADGSGLQARMSFAAHTGSVHLVRQSTLADTEAGSGTAWLHSYAQGVELAWGLEAGAHTLLQPFGGVQDTRSQRAAYTEASSAEVAYPMNYEAFAHNTLYTVLGLRMRAIASERLHYQLSAALQYKERRYGSDLRASSAIYKLESVALDMRDGSANPEFTGTADLRYQLGKDQQLRASLALRGPISETPQVFKAALGYQVSF